MEWNAYARGGRMLQLSVFGNGLRARLIAVCTFRFAATPSRPTYYKHTHTSKTQTHTQSKRHDDVWCSIQRAYAAIGQSRVQSLYVRSFRIITERARSHAQHKYFCTKGRHKSDEIRPKFSTTHTNTHVFARSISISR